MGSLRRDTIKMCDGDKVVISIPLAARLPLCVAIVASWVPALRPAGLDPKTALQAD
jgi:hypothetical protein